MSKIPQEQWSTIALRYSQGESLASIAKSYGCTAPAIHYFLKRNKTTRMANLEAGIARQTPTLRGTIAPRKPLSDTQIARSSNSKAPAEPLLPPEQNHDTDPQRSPMPPPPQKVAQGSATTAQRSVGIGRAAGLTAALDSTLRAQAEAATEAFRETFDEALAEGSSATRGRLRQAASDLMRVAARTTLVLDRLNDGLNPARIEPADPDQVRPSAAQQKIQNTAVHLI